MKYLLVPLMLLLLTACAAPPKPSPAPEQLLLNSLEGRNGLNTLPGDYRLHLAIERPIASSPLRSREIWYRDADHRLAPFSRHIWADSLDNQLQQLLTEYLGQELWIQAALPDQPGYRADYRLRLLINQWYLDTRSRKLQISLQLNLLDAAGNNLLQQQWSAEQSVRDMSAEGMARASHRWLQGWAAEVSELLYEHLKNLDLDQ
ncbi:ABC-type transport auxiliary lipoprotein family protein [Marinospirillum alkaliphilum]|uniref:Uncharacterized lipoprotein YmbA n=1 Tax=Marinospirillum alkaliphilum DSM 21637 TaxID=1122209 RepID=A0A1K1WY02_9GAMM|nr:ABC-type transport auxiliary lipoprotein family protein [Marinospirillum alkaliphilum]SFX42254.1 Uncharacterized lipoprotein YmbA [Marinospirillum alkaliphilum DSM 21637]